MGGAEGAGDDGHQMGPGGGLGGGFLGALTFARGEGEGRGGGRMRPQGLGVKGRPGGSKR